jgi:glycosyltransferase involved in cell wall biosynthesis
MKKIVVVTYGYPSKGTPTSLTFLKELVERWKLQGLDVKVINPVTKKIYEINKVTEEESVVYPLYRDYRILKVIPFLRKIQRKLSNKSFQRAVDNSLPSNENLVLYSHFLNAGYVAAKLSEKYGYPSYCAFGESTLWSIINMNQNDVAKQLRQISGFVSVSTENTDILVSNGLADGKRIELFPNGIDSKKFYPKDKQECRKKLGLPSDEIIGIFVGAFIQRKGVLRVDEATREISNLKMIYIGSGDQQPTGNNIVFSGRVEHNKIPEYLSAADFFVLPTEAEGCCNAILEAMACGLPIISSVGRFNDDILDESMSIRVKPDDIEDIRRAIVRLCNNESERIEMSVASANKGKTFDINERAKSIAHYIGAIG